MPKATKKSKDKTADFSKAKLKLGKGKKTPSNATNTSFKARSIALPGQQPLERALAARLLDENGRSQADSDLPPTTARGLGLDDVLVQLRHTNGGVRKDALAGLKEVLVAGVEKGIAMGRREGEVGKVVRCLGGLINDEDGNVRKALLTFLGWYLPLLPTPTLSPHLPLVILQTSSALSHIFPDIRLDACRLVHLLLEHVPSHVVGSWPNHELSGHHAGGTGDGIIEGLRLAVGLGAEKGSSTQMGFRMTPASKVVTLRTLLAFVEKAFSISPLPAITEAMNSDLKTSRGPGFQDSGKKSAVSIDVTAADAQLHLEGYAMGIGSWPFDPTDGQWEINRAAGYGSQSDAAATRNTSALYLALQPLLLSTFLECAPLAFAPNASSAEDTTLALACTCASITDILASAILSSSDDPAVTTAIRSGVSDFLRRMAAWFPFKSAQSGKEAPASQDFALSLSYARMALMLAPKPFPQEKPSRSGEITWPDRVRGTQPAAQMWPVVEMTGSFVEREEKEEGKGKGKGKGKASCHKHRLLQEVTDWVVSALAPAEDRLQPHLSPANYSALLPIVWALWTHFLSLQEDRIADHIGEAVMTFHEQQGSKSLNGKLGNTFLCRLLAIHDVRHPQIPFYLSAQSPVRLRLKRYFENIPRTLWELGITDEPSSEQLMRFLLQVGLRGDRALEPPHTLLDRASFPVVSARLAPFFHLTHPTKGSVPGPWTKLTTARVKKIGKEVASVWSEWDEEKRLGTAVRVAESLRSGTDRVVAISKA